MTVSFVAYCLTTAIVFYALFVSGKKYKMPLWIRIIAALVLGGTAGYLFSGENASEGPLAFKWIGDAFVQMIRMLVAPLVFTTLVSGVVAIGDPKKLGSLGGKTIGLYLITTVLAVSIGLVTGELIKPGLDIEYEDNIIDASRVTQEKLQQAVQIRKYSIGELVLEVIPLNPLKTLVETDILGIIFFSVVFGVGILLAGEGGKPVAKVIDSTASVMLKVTTMVMTLAPYSVYVLMAWVLGVNGLGIVLNLLKLIVALYIACIIHMLIVYGGMIKIFLKMPVVRFFKKIANCQSVAFSTSSSSTTLPVTIDCVTNNLGVHKSVAGSVLPIGATINMDGTSIYIGLVALFSAQFLEIPLDLYDYFIIAMASTLVSIGGAAIPSSALVLVVTVLAAFGVSSEQAVLIIALIFPFDRILDMMRTMTNVTGDTVVATVVAKWENALGQPANESKTAKSVLKPLDKSAINPIGEPLTRIYLESAPKRMRR